MSNSSRCLSKLNRTPFHHWTLDRWSTHPQFHSVLPVLGRFGWNGCCGISLHATLWGRWRGVGSKARLCGVTARVVALTCHLEVYIYISIYIYIDIYIWYWFGCLIQACVCRVWGLDVGSVVWAVDVGPGAWMFDAMCHFHIGSLIVRGVLPHEQVYKLWHMEHRTGWPIDFSQKISNLLHHHMPPAGYVTITVSLRIRPWMGRNQQIRVQHGPTQLSNSTGRQDPHHQVFPVLLPLLVLCLWRGRGMED